MKITAKGIYSIRAIFDLAHHSEGKPVSLRAISRRQHISLPFLAQIFYLLRKGGVVRSIRGPKGGFILARPCEEIFIGELLRIVESPFYSVTDASLSPNVKGKKKVDECISNFLWSRLGEQISNLLNSTSMADFFKETECPQLCSFISSPERRKTRSA